MVALKESMNVSHELYEISLELVSPLCWFFSSCLFLGIHSVLFSFHVFLLWSFCFAAVVVVRSFC